MKTILTVILVLFSFAAFPQEHIELYNKAYATFQMQDYVTAKAMATDLIAKKNDYGDAYQLRANCNYYLKVYDEALADYQKDNTFNKNRSSYSVACIHALMGKPDLAFASLESNLSSENKIALNILKTDPDLESLHADARWSSLIAKKWHSDYEMTLSESEERSSAGDFDGAIAATTKAIGIDNTKASAYGVRAIAHIRKGDFNSALSDLNAAVAAEPSNSQYVGNRAYVQNKLGNKLQALIDYEKAIELNPSNLVYYDLAMARYANGNGSGALEAIQKHVSYYTKDEMGLYFAGILASQNEYFDEALGYLNKAIELNNEVSQFYMKRADVFFLQKSFANAITDYSKVISLDPSSGEAYYIRGNAKAEMINRDGACADWRKAVELGFEDSNGYITSLCD